MPMTMSRRFSPATPVYLRLPVSSSPGCRSCPRKHITAPVASMSFQARPEKRFRQEQIAMVMDHFVPNKTSNGGTVQEMPRVRVESRLALLRLRRDGVEHGGSLKKVSSRGTLSSEPTPTPAPTALSARSQPASVRPIWRSQWRLARPGSGFLRLYTSV